MLFQNALLFGALLSVLLAILMAVSLALAPDMWLNDYPPDIRAKYGAISEKGRRLKPIIGVLFFGIILAVLAGSLVRLHGLLGRDFSFGEAALSSFIVAMVFNVFDWLIVDWLVFVKWQPKAVVLPGTEGLAGYKDYGFHFRGFLIGWIFCGVMALLGATGGMVVQLLT